MEQTRRARLTGLTAALLTVAAILWTLFASPSIGVVADGSYASAAEGLALRYAEESLPTGQRVEDFAYEDTAYSTLLFASRTSVGAAVALVRLATHPFGLGFSTRYLAIVYALLMGWGAYLLANGLARRSRTAAILATLGLPLALANPAVIGYLNSLYAVGASMAYLLLFLGATVYCLCREKGCGVQWALLVLFAAQLMLRTMAQMMALLPAAVLAVVLCAVHSCPGRAERPLHAACVLIASLMCVSGLVTGWQADDTVHSAAANYLAVFQGYLPASEKPEETLEALGLPESYLADIGKSYYEPSENFVNDPRDAENAALLNENISLGKRVSLLAKHTDILSGMLEQRKDLLANTDNWYLVNDNGEMNATYSVIHVVLERLLGYNSWAMGRNLLVSVAMLLLLMPVFRKQKQMLMLGATIAIMQICALGFITFDLAITGGNNLVVTKAFFFFMGWLSAWIIVIEAATLANAIMNWLRTMEAPLAMRAVPAEQTRDKLMQLHRLHVHEQLLPILTVIVCVIMFIWQVLPDNHLAGVNNGDYGRMMEQIDLRWAAEQIENASTQAQTCVVEKYALSEALHLSRLTSADPTYSLVYPSMLIRIWSWITKTDYYSTYAQSILLFLVTCIALIVLSKDLQKLYGKGAYILMALLLCVFFGEVQLAWNNSLFGEATIPASMIAVLACAIHLIVIPRGGKGKVLSLILLAISLRMLACSKAQLALSIPAALILMFVFTQYHFPKLKLGKIGLSVLSLLMSVLICFDAVMIYKKNQPVSEKQTIWQSVFYGLLLIVDDQEETMNELGIPLEMKADIGKHAYLDESEYVYPITSKDAEEKFYNHISTFKIVGYYITHPKYLLIMLNHAAEESRDLHTGFMEYRGKPYNPNCDLFRFNIWRNLRSCFAAKTFYGYFLFYGLFTCVCIYVFFSKKISKRKKLFATLLFCIMLIGVTQYPLTVLGNGFADNNKQLYTFMLCHDLMIIFTSTIGLKLCFRYAVKRREVSAT